MVVLLDNVLREDCSVRFGDLVEEVCSIDGLGILEWLGFWDWRICGMCVCEVLGWKSKLAAYSDNRKK